jgi:outer membrane lipoprotein carrier protein
MEFHLHGGASARVYDLVGRLAFFLCAGWATAMAADLDAILSAVEKRYNNAKSLQVEFKETYSAPSRPRRTESGTLYLRKPGRMRWEYSDPAGKLFVSDGKDVYLYTPNNKRVEKMKMKESEDLRAPLAFLLGRLDFKKEFGKFTLSPDPLGTRIVAEPRSQRLPYTKVEFIADAQNQLRRVIVTGYDQSVLDFEFSGEKVNPPLAAGLFEFRMPEGARLAEETG